MENSTKFLKGHFHGDRRNLTVPGDLAVVIRGRDACAADNGHHVEPMARLMAHAFVGVRIVSPDEDNFEFTTTPAECERVGLPVLPPQSEFATSAPGAGIGSHLAYLNAGLEWAADLAEGMNSHGVLIAARIRELMVSGVETPSLPKSDDRASYSARAVRRRVAAIARSNPAMGESQLLVAARAVAAAHDADALTTELVDALRAAIAGCGGA